MEIYQVLRFCDDKAREVLEYRKLDIDGIPDDLSADRYGLTTIQAIAIIAGRQVQQQMPCKFAIDAPNLSQAYEQWDNALKAHLAKMNHESATKIIRPGG